MTNTAQSFKDKWEKNTDLIFDNTLKEGSDIQNWILNRNSFRNLLDFSHFLSSKKRILDGGCGNGRVTALLRSITDPVQTEIVGIDLVAADVARKNLFNKKNMKFFNMDLLGDLSPLGKFDYIYCQEVLHHTSDPKRSFSNLVGRLDENGEIAIYVYKKKSPPREFTDDFIRNRISELSYDDAMKVCDQITQFGKAISEAKLKITVPAVNILDIPAGEYDVQRLIYNFFFKCFWNPELNFHDNSVINYDWYHPQLCSRHTVEEVREWFTSNDLKVTHEFVDPYGITMHGIRKQND